MKRDFSDSAKIKLFNLIDEVNEEQWFGWTDAIGDFFCWGLNIENYLDDLDSYHKKVVDKNNTTKEQIEKIFNDIHLVDLSYQGIFDKSKQAIEEQIAYIKGLSECIDPIQNKFEVSLISSTMDSINMNFIKNNSFVQAYGFNYEQYVLIKRTFDKLEKNYTGDKNSQEYINYVFNTLYPLCINYDAKRFRFTTNGMNSQQAINQLKKAGLTDQDIADLIVIINVQHGATVESIEDAGFDLSKSKYRNITSNDFEVISSLYSNSVKKDFAHELIQFATFSAETSLFRDCVDLYNFYYTNYEISFKGDIDSTRWDESDFSSDVDAINIYERMKGNSNIFEIYYNYNLDLNNGNIDRATEFLENLGEGDVGIGLITLDQILDAETPASEYISSDNDDDDINAGKAYFMQWLLEQYIKERDNLE